MHNQVKLDPKSYPYNIRQMFVRRFAVEVPSIALKSIRELKERGVYAIGEDDREHFRYAHAPVDTYLTINHCFEIWRAGHEVVVKKVEDTLEMFGILTLHLQTWVGYLDRGIQVSEAPFEELLAIDKFIDKIYPHAQKARTQHGIHYFKESMSSLGFNLNPTTQLGSQSFFMPLNEIGGGGGRIDLKDVDVHEEREGFEKDIARLGGRLSAEMRESERSDLFRPTSFGLSTKVLTE